MPCTWILVADTSQAKIYSSASRIKPLAEVEEFDHPEGRMHEGDLVSDSPGSDGGTPGQGRHVMDDKTSAKDQEAINFSKTIAGRLEAARNSGEFDKLVLIAPSGFLGLLRSNIGKQTMAMVTQQVNKNLVQKPADVIRDYLP